MITASRVRSFIPVLLAICATVAGSACTRSKPESPNTLRIGAEAKIKGLDPAFSDDIYSGAEVSRGYEGLYQYHYLKRPYEITPNLAEALPQVSPDGTTYTIRLKKGVLFHDDPCFKESGGKGREMTVEDVFYSWKRLADPKTTSSGWWIFDGKIVGLNEWRDAAGKSGAVDYTKPVEGLKAIDRYTLQIKLTKRSTQFLFNLAQQFSFVISKEAVEMYGKEFINHAVGTGPFRLQEFNGASKVIWVRNPTYRKEVYPSDGGPGDQEAGLLADAGKPIPFVDKIIVQVYEEQQPRWLTFLSGKLDLTTIPKDSYDQTVTETKELKPEFKAKGLTLYKAPTLDLVHLSFNMADPLVGKNKLLRQAISLAYDSETFIKLFYNGRGIQSEGPIPPGIAGYDENFKNSFRRFNLAKARELLAKAGYPEGKGLPALEYNTMADSTARQFSEYDQKTFGALGIQLKINTFSWPEFSAAIKNRHGQLWSFGWTADYPDAENFLQLFYSKNSTPGPNDSNYSNPEFDKLYEKSLRMSDTPERTAVYKQMVQVVTEDCPWIFIAHRVKYGLVQPWLRNYKLHDLELGREKYFRIDPVAVSNRK